MTGLFDRPRAGLAQPGFAFVQGLALCEAYEAYRTLVSAAHISFEHMIYLFTALDRGDELRLATCAGCGALLVVERMALKEPRCAQCASLHAERENGRGIDVR